MQGKDKFFSHEIGDQKIYLQDHIAKKILQFPDVINDKKILHQFLGIVDYARNYIETSIVCKIKKWTKNILTLKI